MAKNTVFLDDLRSSDEEYRTICSHLNFRAEIVFRKTIHLWGRTREQRKKSPFLILSLRLIFSLRVSCEMKGKDGQILRRGCRGKAYLFGTGGAHRRLLIRQDGVFHELVL